MYHIAKRVEVKKIQRHLTTCISYYFDPFPFRKTKSSFKIEAKHLTVYFNCKRIAYKSALVRIEGDSILHSIIKDESYFYLFYKTTKYKNWKTKNNTFFPFHTANSKGKLLANQQKKKDFQKEITGIHKNTNFI